MRPRNLGFLVLGFTYSVLLISLVTFYWLHHNESLIHYWCVLLLCPPTLWLWALISWCDSEMFASSKDE
ncbi:eri1p [Saccharomyces arboricola H-6]|uniref:Eri1p n=1 Tax=Saccharomyces arboricola (strain H-6 / AS 2.3317 / CBS 10644) TaxID=1160507 RepID=J8PYD2_SACAR|nr:eri1p [Saccharomyces arboricola H-6]